MYVERREVIFSHVCVFRGYPQGLSSQLPSLVFDPMVPSGGGGGGTKASGPRFLNWSLVPCPLSFLGRGGTPSPVTGPAGGGYPQPGQDRGTPSPFQDRIYGAWHAFCGNAGGLACFILAEPRRAPGACAPLSNFFIFFMWFLGKIGQNNRLAPPPLLVAPSSGKSWIRHCFNFVSFSKTGLNLLRWNGNPNSLVHLIRQMELLIRLPPPSS